MSVPFRPDFATIATEPNVLDSAAPASTDSDAITRVVYKYPIYQSGLQTLYLPLGARVLSAQWQHPHGCVLWVLIEPSADMEPVQFLVTATGQPQALPVDRVLDFIDTIQLPTGEVFHIFRVSDGAAIPLG